MKTYLKHILAFTIKRVFLLLIRFCEIVSPEDYGLHICHAELHARSLLSRHGLLRKVHRIRTLPPLYLSTNHLESICVCRLCVFLTVLILILNIGTFVRYQNILTYIFPSGYRWKIILKINFVYEQ